MYLSSSTTEFAINLTDSKDNDYRFARDSGDQKGITD